MTESAIEPRNSAGVDKLHSAIATGKTTHGIALMSHAVVGYPSIAHNVKSVAALVGAGAEMMELQFPFSDPLADGPVLTAANQRAVELGTTIDDCFEFAGVTTTANPQTAFVTMTYINLIYRRGIDRFVRDCADARISAIIVADLPPDSAGEFRRHCDTNGIGTIFLVTPLTPVERVADIASLTTGFIYCVGRPGVSGDATVFDESMLSFIKSVKNETDLPVGVGFGIRTASDVDALRGTADIAIVCTEVIRRVDAEGIEGAAGFLANLRPGHV